MVFINEELRGFISIEIKNAHALESYHIESRSKKNISEENIACLLGFD